MIRLIKLLYEAILNGFLRFDFPFLVYEKEV
jgi:hypothetical protein